MQGMEISLNRVAVTNVALASLRLAVAQQMHFETLLEDVVKRQEDGFGSETATTAERDAAGKKVGKGNEADKTAEQNTGFVAKDQVSEDRGGALNIQV